MPPITLRPESDSSPDPNSPDAKINRVGKACQPCRRKKQKCDGNRNGCSRCKRLGIKCFFEAFIARRGRPPARHYGECEQILFEAKNSVLKQISKHHNQWMRLQLALPQTECAVRSIGPRMVDKSNYEITWFWDWAPEKNFDRVTSPSIPANDMLSILIAKFSALSVGERIVKNFPRLAYEESDFAEYKGAKNPLESLTEDQALYLLHVWFKQHVFCNILNQTIMVSNYRRKQFDPFLYAVVFADALDMVNLYNMPRVHRPGSFFVDYALSLLERETFEPSLPKLQGLFLLSIILMDSGESRKGLLIVALARRMASQLRIPELDDILFGDELDPIERELRTNIWWAMRIAFSWGVFHSGLRVDNEAMTARVKLPVKDEKESVLYELDRSHGFCASPEDYANVIRTFYSCAYLIVVFTEMWMQIVPAPSGLSLLGPQVPRLIEGVSTPSPQALSRFSSDLAALAKGISGEHELLDAAQLLLSIHTLIIHSYFPKAQGDQPIFIEENTLLQCLEPADSIVDLAEKVLEEPSSFPLHSIVVFGLNTSACVHMLMAMSHDDARRDSASEYLKRTLQILRNRELVCPNQELVRTIEDFQSAKGDIEKAVPALEGARESAISVVLPRVKLRPLSDAGTLDETTSTTQAVVLIRIPKQATPEIQPLSAANSPESTASSIMLPLQTETETMLQSLLDALVPSLPTRTGDPLPSDALPALHAAKPSMTSYAGPIFAEHFPAFNSFDFQPSPSSSGSPSQSSGERVDPKATPEQQGELMAALINLATTPEFFNILQ
ncbi:uncharacterized protein VTP21DRAFT_6977 [Calcarisporiella thermophila]|uniref:uncharacterized protein n=1 Tax=Calcarisporiella thermophila TaxID=911321 RepID=UPI00374454E8